MIGTLLQRALRAFLVLLFGAGLIHHAIAQFQLSTRLLAWRLAPVTTSLTIAVLVGVALALVLPLIRRTPDRRSRIAGWLALIAIVLVAPFTFVAGNFGYVDFETVLISMAENRPSDMVEVAIKDFSGALAELLLIATLMTGAALYLLRRMPGFVPVLLLLAVFGIATSHPVGYLYRQAFPDPALAMVSAADLIAPQIVAIPVAPPNLVLIYLESLERSYRDIPAAADAFAGLAALEDRGFSARNLAQIRGTHFSAAGLVATHCGIPLLPRGMTDPKTIRTAKDIATHALSSFLPGVTCISDVLLRQGYEGAYVNGSDADIFAIADFLKSHGYATVRGLKSEPDRSDVAGTNTWGVPDTELFLVSTEELHRLASTGKPFFLTLFTASTHGPNGYVDPGCSYVPPIPPAQADSLMPATIHCTARLIHDFLAEIDRLGLTGNTVVVVMSDHLAMPNTMVRELRNVGNDRRNLFVILNGANGLDGTVSDRPATMLDAFPTVIEAMGFGLKDGTANLGRSLLSPGQTLTERLGLEVIDRALFGNQAIRRSVWTPP